jgi:hypothetical protein
MNITDQLATQLGIRKMADSVYPNRDVGDVLYWKLVEEHELNERYAESMMPLIREMLK